MYGNMNMMNDSGQKEEENESGEEVQTITALSNCPTWQSSAKTNFCSSCNKQFSLVNRKHHCRQCGGVFCRDCTRRASLPDLQFKKPVRICTSCYAERISGVTSIRRTFTKAQGPTVHSRPQGDEGLNLGLDDSDSEEFEEPTSLSTSPKSVQPIPITHASPSLPVGSPTNSTPPSALSPIEDCEVLYKIDIFDTNIVQRGSMNVHPSTSIEQLGLSLPETFGTLSGKKFAIYRLDKDEQQAIPFQIREISQSVQRLYPGLKEASICLRACSKSFDDEVFFFEQTFNRKWKCIVGKHSRIGTSGHSDQNFSRACSVPPGLAVAGGANKRNAVKLSLPNARTTTALDFRSSVGMGQKPDEEKKARLRRQCLGEIISTERDYVADLECLIDVFLNPIKFRKLIGEKEVNIIFSNVETILPVNKQVLAELLDPRLTNNGTRVGEIFKRMAEYFKMYTVYCANQQMALDTFQLCKEKNPEFAKAVAVGESDPRAYGQNLSSFLIKPVQRICKYPLFFREILKCTPETHEDFNDLTEAAKKIEDVVSYVNEGKRKFEAQRKLLSIFEMIEGTFNNELITPTRIFIQEGNISGAYSESKQRTDFTIFLFNDLMLICRQNDLIDSVKSMKLSGSRRRPLRLLGEIPLFSSRVIDVSDTDTCKCAWSIELRDNSPKKSQIFTFFAVSEEEKEKWLKLVKSYINEEKKRVFSEKRSGTILLLNK